MFFFYTINLFSKWFVNDNFQLIHLTLSILFEIKSTNMSCLVSFCHKIGFFFYRMKTRFFFYFPFDMRIELNCCFHFNWMSLTRFICFSFMLLCLFFFFFFFENLIFFGPFVGKNKEVGKKNWKKSIQLTKLKYRW